MSKKKPNNDNTIVRNKSAFHEYFIEEQLEAGLALEGWEVKSLREKRAQLKESYVQIKDGEAFVIGCHISPMASASTHVKPNPTRMRKLLLHKDELSRLIGAVERRGYTLVPVSLYWKRGRAKLSLGLGKGKKAYDKRATEKARDWQRDKQRLLHHADN